MPAFDLRNGASCWYPGSLSTSATVKEQDEHSESSIQGADEAADTRRGCDGKGEEDGRCEESVLWWEDYGGGSYTMNVCIYVCMNMGTAWEGVGGIACRISRAYTASSHCDLCFLGISESIQTP